jgi:gas vesicle protein
MKYVAVAVPSAILGAALGALAALLFAPSSGEEFRANIKTQMDTQVSKGKEVWNKSMEGVETRVAQINEGVQEKIGQAKVPSNGSGKESPKQAKTAA